LLYFNYKTTKKFTYKKKITDSGNEKVIEKGDDFNPPEEMMEEGRFEKITKTIDVWYEGIMVMGTQILLKWELAENMVRPKTLSLTMWRVRHGSTREQLSLWFAV
jgi:hypothetical protein